MARQKAKKKKKAVKQKTFEELLRAAFNISPETEAGNVTGERITTTALDTTRMLFTLMKQGKAERVGVLLVAQLLTECSLAENPEAYAKAEIDRGWKGDRIEFERAGIDIEQLVKDELASRK